MGLPRNAPRLLLAAALAGVVWVSAAARTGATPPVADGPRQGYAGSEACRSCHRAAYDQWARSVHVRMTQRIEDANVQGDFTDGNSLRGRGAAYRMQTRSGRPVVAVQRDGGTPETFDVHYTLGEKRLQGYMSRLPDGRIYVLPVFWHSAWRRWIDWSDLTPAPDGPHDSRQIWNINCFNCHATNIARGFDLKTRTYATTATEMGVGCEACHGPGQGHVERMRAWGTNPASYPEIDLDAPDANLSAQLDIFVPRTSSPRQVFDSCAYCHGNKTNHFVGFTPGERLEDFAQLSLVSDPLPISDRQGDFWPDGRPSRFNRPQALTMSGCFARGGATCASCHASHGSTNPHSLKVPLADSDSLCTQCHDSLGTGGGARVASTGPARTGHTRHAAGSAGSSCIACHMSDANWRLLMRRRDHTFAPPVPEVTARYGAPNACNTCHDDRTPEWTARAMDNWYGDRERRAKSVATADAFYGGATGDAVAVPSLARLAVDRLAGSAVRASAVGFLGRLGATRAGSEAVLVNALAAAASDPEAMVRSSAVRALANVSPERAVPVLAARLRDAARVVRIGAAESLMFAGVVTLPGALGADLARVQAEYAQSLRTFDDDAAHHASLGWLHLARGASDEAERELRTAAQLDPSDARPHVYLGVLAARAGRYEEALQHWGRAKERNPGYPNLDRLTAEAVRQSRQR